MQQSTASLLQGLSSKQHEWKSLPTASKLAILKDMLLRVKSQEFKDLLEENAVEGSEVTGFPKKTAESNLEARVEMATQTMFPAASVVSTLEWFIEAYEVISEDESGEKRTSPYQNLETSVRSNNQVAVKTFPLMASEKCGPLGNGEGWLLLDPTHVKQESQVNVFQVRKFLDVAPDTGAMVVLGAGNYTFLTVEDVFHGLFAKNTVVLLKHHPLRPYLESCLRYIMAPLFEAGYISTQSDDVFDRKALSGDASQFISSLHMTGGKATHDAIVWGNGPRMTPKVQFPVTSELGCITPWIVAPFVYSVAELAFQQRNIAVSMNYNASCNCNAPKMVFVDDQWLQKDDFVKGIRQELQQILTVPAYYPGCPERWQKFRDHYPDAIELHHPDAKSTSRDVTKPVIPWLVIELEVDFSKAGDAIARARKECVFRNEPFCPVLTVVTVKGLAGGNSDSTARESTFLQKTTELCNEALFGSLSATVMAPTNQIKHVAVQECLDVLRYGAVVVNAWSAMGYGLKTLMWGAFHGESIDNVESGIGYVHNLLFIEHVQKAIFIQPCIGDDLLHVLDPKERIRRLKLVTDLVLTPSASALFEFVKIKLPIVKVAIPAAVVGLIALVTRRCFITLK